MKTEANVPEDFYQNLGKLFYAIAAADGKVEKPEINELKKFIKNQWQDGNSIGEKTKYPPKQIEATFNTLKAEATDADACFDAFLEYKNKQPSLFDEDTKARILKTASAIANSFSSLNKSELIMLAKLDMAFKKQTL